MPKVNTFNYDTIASWNGSEDLFVVEQPDGTKVATPAMVKQFIEAGDFEATGEVKDGHGNVLKDMAKASNVDSKIGDLSQTGLTGDSVAAQLSDAKGQIAGKTNSYVSTSSGTTQAFNIGAYARNGCYLFSCGYASRYVLGLIAISDNGNIAYSAIANGGGMTVTNKTFDRSTGDIQVVVSDSPYTNGRLTKVC